MLKAALRIEHSKGRSGKIIFEVMLSVAVYYNTTVQLFHS